MLNRQLLHHCFQQAQGGTFDVAYWDGSHERYGSGSPRFTLTLHDAGVLSQIAEDIALGFGEAYMDGRLDVEGDLSDVIELAWHNRHIEKSWAASVAARAATRVVGMGRRSLGRQKDDVAHHYDLGNDFFRLWLDDSMTYSCALFADPLQTLEAAQRHKIDHSLRKLRLRPEKTLLDIGSGWGSVVLRAAECYGARALGITLSEEQMRASCDAIAARGLEERASVRLIHYAALAREGRQFDRIVSIGMIEHVGQAHLAEFAAAVRALLKPGGLALLHHITSPEPGQTNAWTDRYIFPGGYMPMLAEMLGHLQNQGLRVQDVENLRPHYALTLDRWSERFEANVDTVREQFGERFVRMWRLYLRSAAASFRTGAIEVHQILVSNGPARDLPLTRADLYR